MHPRQSDVCTAIVVASRSRVGCSISDRIHFSKDAGKKSAQIVDDVMTVNIIGVTDLMIDANTALVGVAGRLRALDVVIARKSPGDALLSEICVRHWIQRKNLGGDRVDARRLNNAAIKAVCESGTRSD